MIDLSTVKAQDMVVFSYHGVTVSLPWQEAKELAAALDRFKTYHFETKIDSLDLSGDRLTESFFGHETHTDLSLDDRCELSDRLREEADKHEHPRRKRKRGRAGPRRQTVGASRDR